MDLVWIELHTCTSCMCNVRFYFLLFTHTKYTLDDRCVRHRLFQCIHCTQFSAFARRSFASVCLYSLFTLGESKRKCMTCIYDVLGLLFLLSLLHITFSPFCSITHSWFPSYVCFFFMVHFNACLFEFEFWGSHERNLKCAYVWLRLLTVCGCFSA